MQQDNQVPAVSPREVEMMVACTGGRPVIAVPDVAEVTAQSAGEPPRVIDILRIGLQRFPDLTG